MDTQSIFGTTSQNQPPQKKKRNLPGNPNQDCEVVAFSPRTLMATNRFVCEICKKGFQREQNLQLHRRGHNLPWKLKQRSSGEETRRKVYMCPEPTCAHHDPSRALGDLTGIKKHFSRKHGDKKFGCQKCSKRYAVQSDWKAHSKTCGTREYRCHCGTLFSRRDSFITHRAFCDDALDKKNHIIHQYSNPEMNFNVNTNNTLHPIILSPGCASSDPTNLFYPFKNPIHPNMPINFNPNFHVPIQTNNTTCNIPYPLMTGITNPNDQNPHNPSNSDAEMPTLFRDQFYGASVSRQLDDFSMNQTFMSATSLLQKASQMGSSSLHGNDESRMHGLMNSALNMNYGDYKRGEMRLINMEQNCYDEKMNMTRDFMNRRED